MVTKNQYNVFISYGQMNLINEFRSLWLDLATWMGAYIISTMSNLENINAIGERLYRIPVDFKNKLELVFGQELSEGLLNLLSMNIILTQNILTAQKNGDTEAVNSGTVQLYQNIDQLSSYLSQMNPYWSEIHWKNLFYNYTRMIFEQSVAYSTGDHARAIDIYERLAYHSTLLGDYMANGIMQYLLVRGFEPTS